MTAANRLRIVAIVLALIGIGVAGYLTYVHYDDAQVLCTSGGGCEKVQESAYAKLVGIPVALLGLLAYAGILALSIPRREETALAAAGLALAGLGFSLYLQYRSFVTLDAHCIWCIGSATVMTLLTATTTARALTHPT